MVTLGEGLETLRTMIASESASKESKVKIANNCNYNH